MGPERNKKSSSAGNGNNPNVRQPYNPIGAHHHLQVNVYYILGFPTGRDSGTFRDKGTEVSSLSRDKGTTGQAQILPPGRAGILTGCPVSSRDVPRDRHEKKD